MAIKKQQKRSLEESQSVPFQNGAANKKSQKFKKMKTEKEMVAIEKPKKVKKDIPAVTLEAKIAAKRLKNAEKLKNKNANRKEARKEQGQYKPEKVMMSPEAIELRIKEIQSRSEITKTAKRKLALLKKRLRIAQGTFVPKPKPVEDGPKLSKTQRRQLRKKSDAAKRQAQGQTTDSKISPKIQAVEKTNKKGVAVVKIEAIKQEKIVKLAGKKAQQLKAKEAKKFVVEEEPEDSEDEDDEEAEEEEEDTMKMKLVVNEEPEGSEDEDDEEEEEQDAEDEETGNDDDEDDDDEEDEDDEEEEEDEQEEEAKVPVKKVKLDQEKKQPVKKEFKKEPVQDADAGKKKRFVLFVGNLPFDASPEDIKKHFLTKVSAVSSVRVPSRPGTNTPRGFAYVEVENDIDYEKGLSFHNTILNGRRLNVEYTRGGSKSVGNRQDIVSKNKKLHAMRKQGMLAGSQKDGHKRNDRRQKQRQQRPA